MIKTLKRTWFKPGGDAAAQALAWALFLSLNWGFFLFYSSGKTVNPSSTYFTVSTDHANYARTIEVIKTGEYRPGPTNNNAGISYLYLWLSGFFGDDLPRLALAVNTAVFFLSFLVLRRLLPLYGLPRFLSVFLLLNPATLYFSHFINKESFSLLAVLSMVYCAGSGRWKTLLLLIPLSMVARLQLGIFGAALALLFYTRHFFLGAAAAYFLLSLGGALVVTFLRGFDPSLWGNGLVQTVYGLNRDYYVGSLLLNPIRAMQYLIDLRSGAGDFLKNAGIALYNLKDIPSVMALLALSPFLAYMFVNLHVYKDRPSRAGICAVLIYMLVQLMNPVIHARYLFPVLPVVFILALFVLNEKRSLFAAEEGEINED